MTDARQILLALGEALHDNQISEDMCYGAVKALRSVPPEHHMSALKSLLGLEEPEPEEQPEDYLAVKTFDSSEFHVGDEIVESNGVKGIYVGEDVNTGKISVVYEGGFADNDWDKDKWHRTGRSFPAISAILEEIKKH